MAPPSNVLDLIHDFIAEEWHKLARIYDPARGTLEALVFTAFVRHARKAIIRLNRQHEIEMSESAFESLDVLHTAADGEADSAPDRTLMQKELEALPEPARRILHAYLAGNSIRTIANTLTMSRYRATQYLGEAIARIALSSGDIPAGIPAVEWEISRALLGQCSLAFVASRFTMKPSDVRKIHRRNISALLRRLATINRNHSEVHARDSSIAG
ncbi:MAG: hypothetical protein JST22_13775 [Bacteroidetes bacterium]|nr:hypothetical protein [Bacteroidota bacterium]